MSNVFTRWWTTYSSVDKHTQRTINWLWETALASFCDRMQFSSVQDGIYALGKAHMRSNPSFRSFPNTAFETVNSVTEHSSTVHNKNEAPQQYKVKQVQMNPKNESAETSTGQTNMNEKNSDPISTLSKLNQETEKKVYLHDRRKRKLFPQTDIGWSMYCYWEIRSMLFHALLTLCQACFFLSKRHYLFIDHDHFFSFSSFFVLFCCCFGHYSVPVSLVWLW